MSYQNYTGNYQLNCHSKIMYRSIVQFSKTKIIWLTYFSNHCLYILSVNMYCQNDISLFYYNNNY